MLKQELKKITKAAFICASICIFIAVFTALLLRTPLWAGQKAFLYRLLATDVLCCVLLLTVSGIVYAKVRTLFGVDFSTNVLCIGISTLFMALFFSLGPMVIERSYTVYSLADMTDHAGRTYSAEEIKTQFIEGYIEGAGESQKRIDEQVYIGNLRIVEGGYQITEKGQRLVHLFRFLEMIFPVPDEHSIYPNGRIGG